MLRRLVSLYSDWKAGHSAVEMETTTSSGREDEGENESGRADDATASTTADGATDAAASPEPGGEENSVPTGWQDLLSGETVSKQEVQVELGLQPHEFLAWLVRSSGGRMWQADMVETTGWSKSTVSRYLDTLETNDIVERVQIGRRKLVGVPEEMPTGAQMPENPSEESAPNLGSWTDEAA